MLLKHKIYLKIIVLLSIADVITTSLKIPLTGEASIQLSLCCTKNRTTVKINSNLID